MIYYIGTLQYAENNLHISRANKYIITHARTQPAANLLQQQILAANTNEKIYYVPSQSRARMHA